MSLNLLSRMCDGKQYYMLKEQQNKKNQTNKAEKQRDGNRKERPEERSDRLFTALPSL